ncbi:MAG: site-specific integrase [Oscillospiraceae bacterium]|nr:site-specific integrase [Oscillospiraceae bacterium]
MSTIYKRKDGRWEGRIYKGNGNYVSYYAHSRQDIEELLLHMSEKSEYSECSHSFQELFTQWFDNISLNIKESTACNYKMKANTHLIPYFKDISCSAVNEKDIYGFINIKREENLSDRYIADMIVMVKSVFKFGTKTYNYKNPFNDLKISFKKSEKVKVLDSEQYSALQKELASENSRTSAAVSLAMATGLRIGELCALQWKDVDIKKRILTVSKTIQRIKSEDTVNKTKIVLWSSFFVTFVPEFIYKISA